MINYENDGKVAFFFFFAVWSFYSSSFQQIYGCNCSPTLIDSKIFLFIAAFTGAVTEIYFAYVFLYFFTFFKGYILYIDNLRE